VTAPDIGTDDSDLNQAEKAFLEAVLLCHGVCGEPTEANFKAAMKVMSEYAQQVQDNPPEGAPSLIIRRWLSSLSNKDRIKIAAAAFVRFGATKPSIFQLRAAHKELFNADPEPDFSS
jgi:hypothetical protein